jgi:hypothetical protein
LHVTKTLNFQSQTPDAPTYGGSSTNDGTQIMDAPRDLGKMLGMPDTKDSTPLSDVSAAMQEKVPDIQKDQQKAQSYLTQINSMSNSCSSKASTAAYKALADAIDNWNNANCSLKTTIQDQGNAQPVITLSNNVNSVLNGLKQTPSGVPLIAGISDPTADYQTYLQNQQAMQNSQSNSMQAMMFYGVGGGASAGGANCASLQSTIKAKLNDLQSVSGSTSTDNAGSDSAAPDDTSSPSGGGHKRSH